MTVAFVVLVVAGLAALLAATWLLVAGERRRAAASLLIGGVVALLLAGGVVFAGHQRYEACMDDKLPDTGPDGLPALYLDEVWDQRESACDKRKVFAGSFGY